MQLEPFTIYTFTKGRVLYGVARYRDLETDVNFGSGFRLDRDKKRKNKDNTPERIKFRAKRNVVNEVSNSLNALLMYGKDILEDNEVDWNKFRQKELEIAEKIIKETKKFRDKKGETEERMFKQFEDDREKFENERKVKTFKVVEISLTIAKENKLI